MSLFYHRRKGAGLSVPNILGMTASPIMKTNPQGLAIIESTLDAICRTPIKHRAELRLEVKLPLLLRVQYQKPLLDSNKAIQSLSLAYVNLDIEKDPYFAKLSKDKSEQGQNNLARVRLSGKTSCCDQIKSFCTTAKTILQDLGPWAANYYVAQVISKIGKIASGSKGFPHGWDTANAENKYLIKALQGVETSPTHFSLNDVQSVSDKVGKLVEILIQEEAGFSGIVFVQPTLKMFAFGTVFTFDLKLTNMYEDDMRNLQEYLVHEDAEEHDGRIFQVTSTNAVLDLDNSVAHLYHFCAKLPPQAYVDRRPEFICFSEGAAIRAKVILPLSVDESVRVAESQRSWLSEKNAMKDAAFQSYVALHKNGLVNDNLLPTVGNEIVPDDLRTSSDARSSLESVHEQLNPWVYIAQAWKTDPVIHQYIITFQSLEVAILIPAHLQQMPPFKLYWDAQTEFSLDITMRTGRISSEMRSKALDDTWALLQTAFGTRFTIERKPLVLQFVANEHLSQMMGTEDVQISRINETTGLIRDKLCPSVAYIFKEFLATKPDIGLVQCPYDGYQDSEESAHLSLERLHRRSDFINRVALSSPAASKKPYATVLPDNMPLKYHQFGRLIPSIMHRFERYLLATMLSDTILKEVGISDHKLIVTAITCSASSEDNYQRLEFLGDTVLKLCTSIELMAKYPLWHEGYLTMLKGRIVSNSSLFAAAILTGLDRFIITKVFNGHKWRPVYVDSLETCSHVDSKREMSSKIPADVVEALVGASMVDGGIPKSLRCLKTFIPQLDWQPLEIRRSALFQRASNIELPATLQPLESLIGYQFQKKGLLIEALTHASCISGSASLERLEFLGDAILDHLVVQALWTYDLSHIKLHLMRTALVNADVLAFLCMEWHTEQEVIDLENNTPRPRQVALPLWKFMRHTSPPIGLEQHATAERHSILAPQIRRILQTGDHYPWALLARLRAQKLYSDLVEALIGAVWVDSGAFEACAAVAERIGIFPVMRRLLDDDVQVLNPKEELGILAVSETVQYVVSRPAAVPDADDETPTSTGLRCAVLVGERRVVEVEHGVSTLEVETRAAEEAVRILKREKVQAAGAGAGAGVGAQGKDDGEGSVDVEMGDA
ncbi:hypothetical protein QTJ16_005133 [Diplocarpon rosae]|uniref:Dicer-like protein 2 n=1 Tax=Diplocarpon rosae TaxID=946125 RepID=A0AAD9SXZ0_9HELO|nr:hypothetical protein QTJ16_005133 [Diplocarpon rosae]